MKSLFKTGLAAAALLLGTATLTNAQTTDTDNSSKSTSTTTGRPKGIVLSVGPEAGLPIGDFKDVYNWSFGGSVQADFPIVSNDLFVSVNAGYDQYFAKNDVVGAKDLRLIPVKAGLKYYPYKNLYIQGLAGVNFLTNKNDIGSDKSAVFTYSPQIGYLIPLGGSNYLDAGVKFEGNSKFVSGGSSANQFGIRVAYAFSL
jgi:hypothetical protein